MSTQSQGIAVGVSSCLLGEQVRYDGGHKRDSFVSDQLAGYFSFYAVCPEVACGMSVPREPIRLYGNPEDPQVVTVKSGIDCGEPLKRWVHQAIIVIKQRGLRGFILKKNSPSCGLYRMKVYQEKGPPQPHGRGIFAHALVEAVPLLPVEEEGRLTDAVLRENFVEQVFAYDQLLRFMETPPDRGALVAFHTGYKLLMMAHSPEHYRQLGRLVSGREPLEVVYEQYPRLFMEGMRKIATPAKHTNVLMHCLGYFKKVLSGWEKAELLSLIERYRQRHIPLIVPITLLQHYVRKYDQQYLAGQCYFAPHPDELMLRNHA